MFVFMFTSHSQRIALPSGEQQREDNAKFHFEINSTSNLSDESNSTELSTISEL